MVVNEQTRGPKLISVFFLQACTWNLRGKSLSKAGDYIHLDHAPEIILLQEVGALEPVQTPDGATVNMQSHCVHDVNMELEHDLHHFRVFRASNDAYLSQVIAVDSDIVENILVRHCGGRFLAVGFRHCNTHRDTMAVSVHFPHTGYGADVFLSACNELCTFITQYSQYDFLLGGDWNCEPGDDRFDMLAVPLSLLGLSIQYPSQPTRFGRTTSRILDFYMRGGPGPADGDTSILVQADEPQVITNSAAELGSDHACVVWDLALRHCSSTSNLRGVKSRAHYTSRRCKRWCIIKDKLPHALPAPHRFHQLPVTDSGGVLWSWRGRSHFRCPVRSTETPVFSRVYALSRDFALTPFIGPISPSLSWRIGIWKGNCGAQKSWRWRLRDTLNPFVMFSASSTLPKQILMMPLPRMALARTLCPRCIHTSRVSLMRRLQSDPSTHNFMYRDNASMKQFPFRMMRLRCE